MEAEVVVKVVSAAWRFLVMVMVMVMGMGWFLGCKTCELWVEPQV